METPQPVNQPAKLSQRQLRNKVVLRDNQPRTWPEQLMHTCEVCGKERMANDFWAKRTDGVRKRVTVCKTCLRELQAVFNSEIGKLSGAHLKLATTLLNELMKEDPGHPLAAEALRVQSKRRDLVKLRATLRSDPSDAQQIRRLRQAVGLPCT